MEQLFYEQSVKNKNIEERAKKTKTLTFFKYACIAIALFVLMTSTVFIRDDSFVFWLGILALIATPFVITAIILNRINKKNNTEYDYYIDDEYLKISEIYYRQTRKEKYVIKLRTIESVGVFESEGYRKNEGKATQKQLALVNYDDEKSIIYVLYHSPKGCKMIFIEPDRGFTIALRRAVMAVTVFDKSMHDFEKHFNEVVDNDIS